MFLLQLPLWSYIVVAASLLAAVGALKLLRRARRGNHFVKRRARAAADLLRMLNDEQVKRAMGINPP